MLVLCALCNVLFYISKFSNFFTQCNVAVLESAPLPTCFTRLRTFSSFKILCTFQPYLKSFEKSLYCIFVCGTICRAMNEVLLYYCYLKLRNSLNLYLIPLKIQKIHYIWHWLWCMFCNVFFGDGEYQFRKHKGRTLYEFNANDH